jgi:hypothetical protein
MTGNRASIGGGIYWWRATHLRGEAVTVASNLAAREGGGVYLRDTAMADLARVILADNCASAGEDMRVYGLAARVQFFCSALKLERIVADPSTILLVGDQVSEDPRFCAPSTCAEAPTPAGEFTLDASSPCAPEHSPCGEQIGALPVACGEPSPILDSSWGALKARSR